MFSKDTLAAKIVSHFLGKPVLTVVPIVGKGRINQIFLVATKTEQIIVRLNEALSATAALAEYTKEQWCLEQASAAGVPGPSVLAVGQSEESAYMVQTFLPGDNAAESAMDRLHLWRELGRATRRIHTIPIAVADSRQPELPSGLLGQLSLTSQQDWLRRIEEGIAELFQTNDVLGDAVYAKERREGIVQRFESLKSLPFRPGLNHGDLSLKNVIVGPDGQISVLDWGSALVQAIPYYDLSQILKNKALSNDPEKEQIYAFLEGYGLSSSEAAQVYSDSSAFLLLRAFGKARWAFGCHHPKATSFVAHAREICHDSMAL